MTPAGTSNELDVQNGWEENTHTHTQFSSLTHIKLIFCSIDARSRPYIQFDYHIYCFLLGTIFLYIYIFIYLFILGGGGIEPLMYQFISRKRRNAGKQSHLQAVLLLHGAPHNLSEMLYNLSSAPRIEPVFFRRSTRRAKYHHISC